MKQAKQRVIALDYFRGLLITVVLLNHSMVFSMPYAYLAGAGRLWGSAAEMFLLLSGITYTIVRGDKIRSDFSYIMKRTWRRAGIIYSANIAIVIVSLLLALFLTSHNLYNGVLGDLPTSSGLGLIIRILTYTYSVGWATFLMYYSMILVFAPFLMYVLRGRYWFSVPALSIILYVLDRHSPGSIYASLGIWQIYFVMGLTAANFRHEILGWVGRLKPTSRKFILTAVSSVSVVFLSASILIEYNIFPFVDQFTKDGWLPWKLRAAYFHLLDLKQPLDFLLSNQRTGLLRPVFALFMLAGGYLVYRRFSKTLLSHGGRFFNTMGKHTLGIFAAQAIAIPIIAALPLPRNPINNFLLSIFLILLMWTVTQRREYIVRSKAYCFSLKASYNEAKYAYLQQYEDSN